MDLYQKAKFYSISKFTTVALSLLANASKENLIRLTHLAEKIPKKEAYREKIRWIRTLFQIDHPALTIARRVLRDSPSSPEEDRHQLHHQPASGGHQPQKGI